MNDWLDRVLAPLDAATRQFTEMTRVRWWLWPSVLLGFALLTWACSLLVEPRPDEWSYLFGMQLGDTCAMIQLTGQPCPSCGMTRSFSHAARFHLWRSWIYNPGGLAMFIWITAAGVVGAVRLWTRDPNRLSPRHDWLTAWVLFWAIGLYALPWILRLTGINPLP